MNLKFQNALKREPQAIPPVWFMRQAGRYHKHYQALRAKHSFIELCQNPKLAAEVAMGPIRDFDFDVAILFSDILFPLAALGMGLKYDPAPQLSWQLNESNIGNLYTAADALPYLQFQKEALLETRRILPKDKSLIGFIGGPWTLFTYAVEGSHKGGLEKAKSLIHLFEPFCNIVLPLLEENIRIQLEGEAEVVMIFDTAAGELSPGLYRDLVVPTLIRLARSFPGRLGSYTKTSNPGHLQDPAFHEKGLFAGLGFDHRWDLKESLKNFKGGFVQGNFDQSLLFMKPTDFTDQARKYLLDIGKLSRTDRAGWVAGLGHGVLPGTPEENVRSYVQLVRETMNEK